MLDAPKKDNNAPSSEEETAVRNASPERREFRRFDRHSVPPKSGAPREHTALVNLSERGMCVWLSDATTALAQAPLRVCLHGKETTQSFAARLVWIRAAASTNEATPAGWLAGLAFASSEGPVAVKEVANDEIAVDLVCDTAQPQNHAAETFAPLDLDRNAVSGLHAVAEDLLPIFAKHFVDLRFVLTRDRLEISAPFRAPGELKEPQAPRENPRPAESARRLPPTLPAHDEAAKQMSTSQNDRTKGWLQDRGFIVAAGVTLVGVLAGLNLLGLALEKDDPWAAARSSAAQARSQAAWARELDPASMPGWLELQKKFELSDADVRSSIRILKANDRYSPGHSLHDLTKYPAQVARAFAMLESLPAKADLGALKSDLGARLANGARFPDEPPGPRYYSNLDPRLLDNTVTLTIIELLQRREQEPVVQNVRAALASIRRTEPNPVPVVMRRPS